MSRVSNKYLELDKIKNGSNSIKNASIVEILKLLEENEISNNENLRSRILTSLISTKRLNIIDEEFKNEIDESKRIILKQKLKSNLLIQTNFILVYFYNSIDEKKIIQLFSNAKLTGGGEIDGEIELNLRKKTALINFKQFEVKQRVLNNKRLKIDSTIFDIKDYDLKKAKQSLEFNQKKLVRYIIVDGSNLAICHGKQKYFSCRGLKICINELNKIGAQDNITIKIRIILPSYRKYPNEHEKPTKEHEILNEFKELILYTPSGQYDDAYILNFAMKLKGLILSNDKFKDFENNIELSRYYTENQINFSFCDDAFHMEPCGNNGKSLLDLIKINLDKKCLTKSNHKPYQYMSETIGSQSKEQKNFQIIIKNGNKYTIDRIDVFTKNILKPKFKNSKNLIFFTVIRGMKIYFQNKEINSFGYFDTNEFESIHLNDNNILENIALNLQCKVIDRIKFHLNNNGKLKWIGIGGNTETEFLGSFFKFNDKSTIVGFFGSFINSAWDGMNTFGLIYNGLKKQNDSKDVINEIKIPANLTGLVIGRDGEQVRQIQDRSGCRIDLPCNNNDEQSDRLCTLIGKTEFAVDKAKMLINEIIKKATQREEKKLIEDRLYKIIFDSYPNWVDEIFDSFVYELKQSELVYLMNSNELLKLKLENTAQQLIYFDLKKEIENLLIKSQIQNDENLHSKIIDAIIKEKNLSAINRFQDDIAPRKLNQFKEMLNSNKSMIAFNSQNKKTSIIQFDEIRPKLINILNETEIENTNGNLHEKILSVLMYKSDLNAIYIFQDEIAPKKFQLLKSKLKDSLLF